MSLSQITARPSAALTLLQQVGPSDLTKTPSDATTDMVKSANGIATTPGAAAKQASGVAFTFTISQAVRDEAQKVEPMGAIVVAGIGGGEVVERFDSWNALEARIRTDRTMNDGQKSDWMSRVTQMKKDSLFAEEFHRSDLFLGLISGSLKAASDAAVKKYLAENTQVSDTVTAIDTDLIKTFLRNFDA